MVEEICTKEVGIEELSFSVPVSFLILISLGSLYEMMCVKRY